MDARDIKINEKTYFGDAFVTAGDVNAFAAQVSQSIDGVLADIKALQAGGGGGGGGVTVDYTAILNSIKASVGSIDSDTDKLQPILDSVDGLEALLTAGNATVAQISAAIGNLIAVCQKVDANTDDVERILNLSQASLTSIMNYIDGVEDKLDQVAASLSDINTLLSSSTSPSVNTIVLSAGANPINLSGCKRLEIINPYSGQAVNIMTASGEIALEAGDSVSFGNGIAPISTDGMSIVATASGGELKMIWE